MRPSDDAELLRAYALRNSEAAFTELVGRHAGLVYSAALRQVRQPELAQEVTQAVFILLARKAQSLSKQAALSGWLCRAAYFVSRDALRAERRRQHRELMATHLETTSDTDWMQIAPLLDEAVAQLSERERNAVVLRFYDRKALGEIGAILGVDPDAAQKRVSRAVEKLRRFFARRGVSSTAAIIGTTLSAHSVQAAPAEVERAVAAAAMKGAAAGSTLILIKGALKVMAWTQAKTAFVVGAGALLVVGTATVVVLKPHGGFGRKEALMQQSGAIRTWVYPTIVKFAQAHGDELPKRMADIKPYLPANADGLDDDHWQIAATGKLSPLLQRKDIVLLAQKDASAGSPKIIVYSDGHVEWK